MNTNKKAVGVAGRAVALLVALLLLVSAAPAQAATTTKTYQYGYATPTEAAATSSGHYGQHHTVRMCAGHESQDFWGEKVPAYHTSHADSNSCPLIAYEGVGIGRQVR